MIIISVGVITHICASDIDDGLRLPHKSIMSDA